MKARIITAIGLGFLTGVTGYFLHMGMVTGIIFVVVTFIFSLFIIFEQKWICLCLYYFLILISFAWSAHYDSIHASKISSDLFGIKVTITGMVVDDPNVGLINTRITILPTSITPSSLDAIATLPLGQGGEIGRSKILVTIGTGANVSYGDIVSVSGTLEYPQNFMTDTDREFDYEHYLALHDIYGIMRAYDFKIMAHDQGNWFVEKLFATKKLFVSEITNIFPSPESGLFAGIVIGEKSLLPKTNLNDFQIAGLTHIIVLSGYNITIVAMAMITLFSWMGFGYRGRRIGAIIIIPIFLIMTGLGASSVRAGIMTALVFLLQITTRPSQPFRIILIALCAMVFFNPRVLLYDPSLHLSFLAFIGLVYMTPIIENLFTKIKITITKESITELATQTLAVQIFVLPYILYMNGRVSLLLFFANILTVPVVPWVMGTGFVATMTGLLWHPIGMIIAYPIKLALTYIIWIAHTVASINIATFTIPPFGAWWVVGVYAVIVLYLVRHHRALTY